MQMTHIYTVYGQIILVKTFLTTTTVVRELLDLSADTGVNYTEGLFYKQVLFGASDRVRVYSLLMLPLLVIKFYFQCSGLF